VREAGCGQAAGSGALPAGEAEGGMSEERCSPRPAWQALHRLLPQEARVAAVNAGSGRQVRGSRGTVWEVARSCPQACPVCPGAVGGRTAHVCREWHRCRPCLPIQSRRAVSLPMVEEEEAKRGAGCV